MLGENGVAFASGMTTATVNGAPTQLSQIASFNISSGEPNWTYQVTPGSQLSLIAAADGNGLGGKATDQSGNDTVIRFDSSGNPSFDTWVSGSVSKVNFFVADDSWVGTTAAGSEGEYFAAPVELSTSSWPEEGGQEQGTANSDLTVTNFSQAAPNQTTIQTVMQGIIAALPNNAGGVTDAVALSGAEALVRDCLENVKKWRFEPNAQKSAVVVYKFGMPGGECKSAPSMFMLERPNFAKVGRGEVPPVPDREIRKFGDRRKRPQWLV